MLPIAYYFWNGYKKSGYVRGKLDRSEYDKRVKQGGKDSNVFVKKLVDSVLEDQAITVKDSITSLEIESNKADKELQKIQLLKSEEESKTAEIFSNKKEILEQEKSRIEEEFANNSLLEINQLKKAKEILGNLLEFLGTYAEEVKNGVKLQGERLLGQRKTAIKYNTKLTAQEIKDNISPKDNKKESDKKGSEKSNITGKNIGYLILLGIMCIFDIFLGYLGIKGFLEGIIRSQIAVIGLGLFLAAIIIPLIIIFIHFAIIGKQKGGTQKVLGDFIIIIVIILAVLYAGQSLDPEIWRELTNNFSFGKLLNILQENLEFLLRCFILPSLFVGEIIIDLINWDLIVDYFGIGKKKGSNSLSRLITNALYFLKNKRISNYAKEEKKNIENLINEMQKEEVPAFAEIKKDIAEIQSILDPIRNKQSQKVEEYNDKIAEVKDKMDKNLLEYKSSLQGISNKYANELNRLENIKRINETKINKLKHDFNQASIDVKEGILIGLIDN